MRFVIKGQISGGKNQMGVTRNGIHYPKKNFSEWRLNTEYQLKQQMKKMPEFSTINQPVNAIFNYIAGDNRRRDATAILDAVFHVLERMGIVEDDRLIGGEGKTLTFNFIKVDKKCPSLEVILE